MTHALTPRNWTIAAVAALAIANAGFSGAALAAAQPAAAAAAAGGTIHITSDYMKYDRKAKMALAQGNVVIEQEDTTIRTAEVQFDQGQKVSYMNQPVHVVQLKPKEPKTTLDSNRMTNFHKEKRLIAEGAVKMVRSRDPYARPTTPTQKGKVEAAIKKEDTVITGDKLEYWTDKKDATFTGNVVIINGKKKSWSDTAVMDHTKNNVVLNGKVRVVQINGNWLVKEGIVKADKPDETRDEALRERATLTCDTLVIDQATSDAVATGQVVRVEQKGKVATSRKAVFSDRNNTITMTDNVRIQQTNGDWLTASKAVFHTNTEVFEAFSGGSTGQPNSQVHTEFDVQDQQKQAPPKKDNGRVQMDFNVNDTHK